MADTENTSMLRKIRDFFTGHRSGEISPADADKLQKAFYALSKVENKKTFSPSYLTLLSGLDSNEKQLFEASVYYLVKIAANKQKYHDEITEILQNKMQDNQLNPSFREYIQQQIQNIL